MARSVAEKAAYAKGYNTALRNRADQGIEFGVALQAMQARAERAEARIGMGRCDQCRHWQREREAAWGYCGLVERLIGLDWPWRGEPNQKIATKRNFGCVRFEPIHPASGEETTP